LQEKYIPNFGSWKERGMKMVNLNNSVIIFLSTVFVNQKSVHKFNNKLSKQIVHALHLIVNSPKSYYVGDHRISFLHLKQLASHNP